MSGSQSLTIDASWLHVADGSVSQPDSALVYTITALPHSGALTVDGTTLALNGQFTQQQIDDGLVVYTETGPTAVDDSFGFSIADASSSDLATGTFNIGASGGTISSAFSGRTMVADTSQVIFFSGPGRNSFTGSADADTAVSYALAPAGVTATVNGSVTNGFGGSDTLVNIHTVIGSSHDDMFFSGPGANLVFGGGGNDQIIGDPRVADASTTTAGFTGTRSDYLVVGETAVSARIIDLRPGSLDGVSEVVWADSFKFSDGSYTLAQLNPIREVDHSGATDVAQIGNDYFLYAHNTATGPELTYQGSPATDGALGSVISAEPNTGGYEVVWYNRPTDTYTAWNVDGNGAYVSTLAGPITERDAAFASLETTLQADLNGDHVIGAPPITSIESFGSTTTTEIGVHYYLFANGTSLGPELMYNGSPVPAGFPGTMIGAEQTASGYEVAWHNTDGSYTVWSVGSNGIYNFSDLVTNVAASDVRLESLETSFHQDLNGDGFLGVPRIESFGSTSLTQVGNDFFLYANGTISGPELTYAGAPYVAGAWAPIGAEKTSTGYEVALFNASSNLYTIWNTDSSGNVLSSSLGGVSGTNTALESIEVSFHQDLNGDGTIGIPGVIETFGATELVQVGNNYFFDPVAGGAGPELTYAGSPFVAGAWAPIGVEKTSTGFEVALFNASSDLFTIWNTDSSGNVLSASLAGVSSTNTALESIEVSFHQDLNGDHSIGIPGVIESFGATQLMEVGNNYFFDPIAGGTGPELKYGGTPFVAGAWAPIGAEQTSAGFEVALFNASSNLYAVWDTDGSGNVVSSPVSGVTGTNTALQLIETSFQQDLNGDGSIGIPGVIESFGATQLAAVGNNYFFNPVAGGTGPELKYGGTPYVAGAWAPIGAEHTSTGYEVALFNASSHLYAVWDTDGSGNVVSSPLSGVTGTNTALQSIETSFQQDLNGDGVIGPASHTSAAAAVTPITAPSSGNAVLSGSAANDTFVFNAHFGNDIVAGFQPGVDQVDLDHTLVASVADLFSHTADNAAGSAVVTISADQSITFEDVSKLVLQQHASDFHLV